MVFCAVIFIVERNEADAVDRKDTLHKITDLNAVAPEPGEVFDDDAVDLGLPDHFQQFLHSGTLKVGPCIAVVNKLQHFCTGQLIRSIYIAVQGFQLIYNA